MLFAPVTTKPLLPEALTRNVAWNLSSVGEKQKDDWIQDEASKHYILEYLTIIRSFVAKACIVKTQITTHCILWRQPKKQS